jgi:trk system potassium uptake protein TrkA
VLLASKASVWARELADPASRPVLDGVDRQYAAAFLIAAGLRVVMGDIGVRRALHRLDLRPAQTVAFGFAVTILAGTVLLSLPLSVIRLEDVSLLDALFDTDLARVDLVRDQVSVAAQIESLEAQALRELGAADVDAAVVAIGDDFASEVLAVALLEELEIGQIVARANTDRERRILELVGASRVVTVEVEMGQRVGRSLVADDVIDHVSLTSDVSLVYWTADERVIGKKLEDSELRSRWQLNFVGLKPAGGERVEILPPADYVFRDGDVLLLVGHNARLAAFTR